MNWELKNSSNTNGNVYHMFVTKCLAFHQDRNGSYKNLWISMEIFWWNLNIFVLFYFTILFYHSFHIISNLAGTLIYLWSFWWNLTPLPAKKVGVQLIFAWWNLKMFSQVALILGQVRCGLPRSLCCLSLPMSFETRCVVFGKLQKNIDMDMLCIYIYIHVSILYLSNAPNIQKNKRYLSNKPVRAMFRCQRGAYRSNLSIPIWFNIWVNISPTWILRPFGDDFPIIHHDFPWGRTVRSLYFFQN